MAISPESTHHLELLFVDDDQFTRAMVSDALASDDLVVRTCASVAEAITLIEQREPHVLITDLDLGPGPSGADLLRKVDRDWPWIGKIALTAHATVDLAIADSAGLPDQTQYVVKGELGSVGALRDWVTQALLAPTHVPEPDTDREARLVVTRAQASAIRLIAEGLSNGAIARRRGITLRSAESLVHRSFQALGLDDNSDINPRVVAAMMWRRGVITTRPEEKSERRDTRDPE